MSEGTDQIINCPHCGKEASNRSDFLKSDECDYECCIHCIDDHKRDCHIDYQESDDSGGSLKAVD